MIAGGRHGLRHVFEQRLTVVLDTACFAVHQLMRTNNVSAKCSPNRLMAQAHAQYRQLAGKVPDQGNADARLLRRTRTRRNKNVIGLQGLDFRRSNLVIAAYLYFLAQFAQILHQVVGKGIVVVEDEDHWLSHDKFSRETSDITEKSG